MTATLLRTGSQVPTREIVPPAVRRDAAQDVIDMADMAGLVLDPWQRHILAGGLGERDDGKWSAFEACLIVPRRNGKSALLEAMILASLFVWGERTVIYSAHRFDAAQETFLHLRQLIEMSDFADEVAKVYTANGKEAIILKSGARVKFMARSRGTGRGFDGDRIILDEAYDLAPVMLGAMIPTMAARSMVPGSNPQVWYVSSAPHASSMVLHSLRQRAIDHKDGDPTRLYFAEWGCDPGTPNDDVEAWYRANPALGIRISEDFVRDEMQALSHSPDEFARERLGVPDLPPSEDGPVAKLPADKWEASRSDRRPTMAEGEVVFAYDVHDGWATICAAAGTLSMGWVEVTGDPDTGVPDHRSGVHWLPARLVELAERWKPRAIGLDGGNGPSLGVLAEVREAFAVAGLDPEILQPLTTGAYKSACESFFTGVRDGKVHRPRLEPDQLHTAGVFAAERTIGDQWLWHRSCKVPISPLVAATVARSLLPEIGAPAGSWFIY